ncbi:hypothetical protein A2210_01710 [Candidatus Woesebacteria bacterium RIFOXYA1_FULL_40_18]|uniref:Uncharacterized protein n=3 Tax=Candidatus Woeseibacteriota TaxID=1752722 RepID=A0A1F8CJY5_9BACT|nr:MAG: hypothetical protein A2210_01710 [Candidatus Woesebacteria bacterium RIFOXYA1_FULL_40_18]OGM80886.1 MAG: hypothetical protein A2361_00220 [Candidatus Woesebacteria bacterium RIFOXYB1_FULL_40_26]OGM88426.1 MAG: hypothetical protein A2614_01960 [Candidatus Woesebacteria bacterium RIFOXYD1_FULL_40_21]
MSKRKRFIITSILLSLGFVGIGILDNEFRFLAIGALAALSIILFTWSLKEGLGRNMTLLTLILPTLFTAGVGIFWFLLPSNMFAKIPIVIFYGLGIYVLCLTSNIYSVAAIRTIALLRAARGVGFVLILITSFLIYDAILSLRYPFYITATAIFIFSFPLFMEGLWTIPLETVFSKNIFNMSLIFALIITETGIALFFWPVTVVVGSLFLTGAVYVLLGLGQAKLEGRLFPQTVREYLVVGILVFIGMFFATHWG